MEDKEQKPFGVGDYVHYINEHNNKIFKAENGRIKSKSGDHIFVVYKCRGEWEHYKDYTGENTPKSNLRHGWVDELQGTPIKTPEDKTVTSTCDHHYLPTNAKWQSATQRECCHCGHIID